MTWHKVASAADIPVGGMHKIELEEDDIALYHLESGWFATSDICTHASQSLTSGTLNGCIVACPKHGGKFDVTTGAAVAFPCVIPLETYDVEQRGEDVWVEYE
jgi:nitrite reductase/ring-hydroxylating ferredoxin subunit